MFSKSLKYILAILLMTVAFAGSDLQAQSKTQLQKQKAQIEAEIKKLDKELAKAKKNTKLSTTQINALTKKINERNKLIKNINSQLAILDNQISRTQDSIALIHGRIDSMKVEYAKVVRMLYREHDNLDKMALIFDTPSYNQSFLRLKYFNDYSRYRRLQAHNIKVQEDQLQEVSLQLQIQKNEKNNLLLQEKRNKEALNKEKQQQQKTLNSSKANEKNISSQIAKKQQQKKELDKQIQRIINEEVAKANNPKTNTNKTMTSTSSSSSSSTSSSSTTDVALSTDFASNKGKLSWPAYYKSVIREFGRYQHESGGENMSNGIELSTSTGASVYCVFNGTVSRVFTCPNGTKGIIIRHGEYMTVYANLSSVNVKEGAKVMTKQTIGTVYTAPGASTGELSFQIWKGTTAQNPRIWLR